MSEALLSLLLFSTLFFKIYLHIKLDVIHERFQESSGWKLPRTYIIPYSGDVNNAFLMDKIVCHVSYFIFVCTGITTAVYVLLA